MADVQLVHFRQRGNWLHVVVGQTVAGVDLQPLLGRVRGGYRDAAQLGLYRQLALGFGVGTGVDLDIGAPTATAASIWR